VRKRRRNWQNYPASPLQRAEPANWPDLDPQPKPILTWGMGERADRVVDRVHAVPGNVLLFSSGHFIRLFGGEMLSSDVEH
jgi:broad specificity phosphatase PhoE